MAYPSTLDTTSTIPVESANTPLSTNHITSHSAIQTAIIAIETLLGVTASAVTGTFNYILGEITGSDKAVGKTATQTLENKTLGAGTAIDLGSDAEGDTYYRTSGNVLARLPRGSDNQILKMNGNVPNWEAETVTVDATSTTAGIVELATAAEITAGTATGGDGPLVVTPDQLAASAPTFSGVNLSNVTRLTRLASYTPAGDTTENTVYTTTIAGGLLSTNGMIKVRTPFNATSTATAETFTIRLKFGGSTLQTQTFSTGAVGGGTASRFSGIIEGWIINNAATNAQNHGMYCAGGFSLPSGPNPAAMDYVTSADSTSAVDTTSNQTLTMTVQRSNGSGASLVFSQTVVETIKNA